jgi:hypothetical protein
MAVHVDTMEPTCIASDFGILRNLGATAVRITVLPAVTGFPDPDPLMQFRLSLIIELAAEHRLKARLSIFDQFALFSGIVDSEKWVRELLRPYAESSCIAFIDLRNELDSRQTLGRRDVDHLLPAVRREAPGTPVSLSFSHPENLKPMKRDQQAEPDFWNLHYYSPEALAQGIIGEALMAACPLPVFVGELE